MGGKVLFPIRKEAKTQSARTYAQTQHNSVYSPTMPHILFLFLFSFPLSSSFLPREPSAGLFCSAYSLMPLFLLSTPQIN